MEQFLTNLLLPKKPQVNLAKTYYGTDYGGWTIATDHLTPDTIIYSLGIGRDISFDREVIEAYGVQVYAFDPTPVSIDWVAEQDVPKSFHFLDYGIADYDGEANFFKPKDERGVSHSLNPEMDMSSKHFSVPVKRLQTAMSELGHTHIDILKMDIEGSEYSVIDDLLQMDIRPQQILVEYHHRMIEKGFWQTYQSIQRIKSAGYRIFDVSEKREEYAFILR